MHFKRIDMHGFKSFAEPVSIEFGKGITCIVGPNGSGKSNISDAIRWVLGEQSPKALRGGKMDEVIFAGTASRKSRGMAEVTIVIDNSDNFLPIEYNEVAITRRMYRSGESEYLINNNRCRLKDVRELIMDTGIGVDGYSLIGQGKIAEIVSNKPESRREIFEEAAGIVMYRTRKAEAEKKLASSNANLDRVNDILSEIENRIGTLKEDSLKAREFLELRETLKTLEINITLKNIEALELKSEYMKDDVSELAISIDDTKKEKESLEKELAESDERLSEVETLIEENNGKLLSIISEINDAEGKIHVDKERLLSIEAGKERLTGELASIEEKCTVEGESLSLLNEESADIDKKLGELNAELTDKIAEFNELSEVTGKETEKIDSMKNEIYTLHSKAISKRSEAVSIKNLVRSLEKRREELLAESENTKTEKKQVETAKSASEAERVSLIENRRALQEKQEKTFVEYQNLKAKRDALQKETTELNLAAERLESRIKTIQEMEDNYEGYNNAVKYIMKSGLAGVRGVAAELMKAPKGYEVAIETAMGAALQNIICTDEICAKKAISVLKENKAGRLTFLPMKSIKGGTYKEDRIEAMAGFLGYGTDCIEFDAQYTNVFRYILGRTVIVDNMDNAIRLAAASQKGLRVVTLQGEVINAGGAITGGRYRSDKGNLLVRKAEIENLSEELSRKKQDEKIKFAIVEQTKDRLEEISLQLNSLQEENRSIEIAVLNSDNRIEIAVNVLKDLEDSILKHERELKSIESEFEKSDEMTLALLNDADEAERTAIQFEQRIEIATDTFRTQRTALDNISDEMTKLKLSAASYTEQRAGIDNMIGRVRQSINELERSKLDKTKEFDALAASGAEITGSHEGIGDILKKRQEDKKYIEYYAEELALEKRALSQERTEKTAIKSECDAKLTGFQNSKYEIEIKQAKNETQLEHYKEKLWEEFEVTYVQAIEFRKKDFNMNASVRESRLIKGKIKELGEVNVGAIKEYASVSERYEFLTEQKKDILQASSSLKAIIEDMDKTIKMRFKENFDKVVVNFEQIFKSLFGGGTAQLTLEDESNPLETGIEIIAQPPGKKLQNINLMSGGEKTMTAIALMFAVLKTKPTPFCILDEVEAALDDANITRFAEYLKNFNDIQFALVTHQKATMEYADILYGVTMPEQGVSKIISLKMDDDFEI
ncbi:MAG: chromosome segregation protein SMC [Eubacteriales bacterium]|nr:chromosome segregation protein SMC [Eubacteriales bacterium]MDD4389540.1 chromosome segregation protein SMC [Eubacteriales bacterium]